MNHWFSSKGVDGTNVFPYSKSLDHGFLSRGVDGLQVLDYRKRLDHMFCTRGVDGSQAFLHDERGIFEYLWGHPCARNVVLKTRQDIAKQRTYLNMANMRV